MKLQIGDPAPVFALADQAGTQHTLAEYAGRKLLIYFYPKADTSGCTRQSCAVRDARSDLSALAMDVVGVSPDAAPAQQKFDDKFELGFPLLCDTEKVMAQSYGVWVEKNNYGRTSMGINRSSFLVDEQGNLAGVWYGVKPEDTVPKALAVAES